MCTFELALISFGCCPDIQDAVKKFTFADLSLGMNEKVRLAVWLPADDS